MSLSSNATINVTGKASNSNNSKFPSKVKRSRHEFNDSRANKRPRHDFESSSSKFKGVVSQLNGNWGAQIYAKHQRIWLGTFKSEEEAAMAYDSAAIKLRDGDSFRNFPWTTTTAQEPGFQTLFSTETVLNMIKDGSYASKFEDYLNVNLQLQELEVCPAKESYSCRKLFEKELTPSDVGKLSRLVIPKKNALKYFPHTSGDEVEEGQQSEEVLLVFYDKSMRLWKFRYCYWKSSQSYVFTRGWNKFVKEKGLKVKDTIIFSHCECSDDGVNDVSSFNLIDVNYYENATPLGAIAELKTKVKGLNDVNEEPPEDLMRAVVERCSDITEDEDEQEGVKASLGVEYVPAQEKGFRLFGVQIN